jgi:hypothetical protein
MYINLIKSDNNEEGRYRHKYSELVGETLGIGKVVWKP